MSDRGSKRRQNKQKSAENDNPEVIQNILNKRFLCGKCESEVVDNPSSDGEESVNCTVCRSWYHRQCTNLGQEAFRVLT